MPISLSTLGASKAVCISVMYAYRRDMGTRLGTGRRMLPTMYGIADRRRGRGGLGTERQNFVDDMLARVGLVPPWSVDEFRRWLEKDLGVAIELRPYAQGSPRQAAECGLLVIRGDEVSVWYDSARSERHQRQQIFHEFAHLLCRHDQRLPLLAAIKTGEHALTAGLPKELIDRALSGMSIDVPASTPMRIESEAELLGTKLAVESVPITADGQHTKRNHARVLNLWRQ